MALNKTFQSNIKTHSLDSLSNYALFLGGLNVTRDALLQYDPLRTGFGRIFMIRKPLFLDEIISDKIKKFKHIIEYANTGVSGNNDITMQFNTIQGGYTNRQMEIPNIATDDANELTIKTYEFSGSPVREVIQMWMSGVADFQSGYSTYHREALTYDNQGNVTNLPICQANQTAEFMYVVTDQSGIDIEYAALFANCFPKTLKLSHFDYESGNHELVPMDLTFTCTRYISPQVNAQAKVLLNKYNILMNSLNFNSGYTVDNNDKDYKGSYYSLDNGKLEKKENNNSFMGYSNK